MGRKGKSCSRWERSWGEELGGRQVGGARWGMVVPGARRRGSRGDLRGRKWLVTLLSLLRGELRPLKAGVMEAEKNTHSPTRHRSHGADKTQGGKRQLQRERKTMEKGG